MDFKKILTGSIIILLTLIGIAIVIGSNKDRRVFFVDDFIQPIKSEIHARKDVNYVYQIVKVKGEVNDTIILVPCKNCPPIKLSGKLNEKFQSDFYEGTATIQLEPYKATSGNLKIIHKIR